MGDGSFDLLEELRAEYERGLRDGAAQEQARIEEGRKKKCKACSLEAEFGSEEDPHPISARFHKCEPLSPRAIAERMPPPPADRVGALHDVVHANVG